jgi:hypothetical protein
LATDERGIIFERLVRLEGVVRQQGEQQDDHGGVLDHLINTLDTIVLPTQTKHDSQLQNQQKMLDEQAKTTSEAHDYIMSQKGAWAFVQRVLLIVAATSGLITLVRSLLEGHLK